MRPAVPLVAALLLFLMLPLLRRRRTWLGLAGIVLALCVFSSCSGNTTTHTYSLTLTATSGTVNHPYQIPVVVK
jgi:formate hydrogenlyase subunit 3/multisubunit Na+/H+ antiporter MnhD subunit